MDASFLLAQLRSFCLRFVFFTYGGVTVIEHPQTCVYPDVCLGIGDVCSKAPLPGQGAW